MRRERVPTGHIVKRRRDQDMYSQQQSFVQNPYDPNDTRPVRVPVDGVRVHQGGDR